MGILFGIFLCLFVAVVIYQCYTGTGSVSRSQHDWHAGPPDNPGLMHHDDDWLRPNPSDPFEDWKPWTPEPHQAEDGWTTGTQGYGYYSGGIRIDE